MDLFLQWNLAAKRRMMINFPKSKYTACWLPVCILAFSMLSSCKSKEPTKQEKINETNAVVLKADSGQFIENLPTRPPIINIMDSFIVKQHVIAIKDSALLSVDISKKLDHIFNTQLPEFARKHNIEITGKRIVWYKTLSSPFFFEAGFPVNKKPAKTKAPVFLKTIGGDSCIVAHYFGPYSNTVTAYDVLYEWLKDNNKKKKGDSYEVYVDNPFDEQGNAKNPYKVGTDVVMPHY